MKFDKKTKIIIGLVILVLAIIAFVTVPMVQNNYREEGYVIGQQQTILIILDDIQRQGFSQINVGDQAIYLAVVVPEGTQ